MVPSDEATYLVHCDLAQHMEKGMKAQLVVGQGGTDLWSVPTVTASFNRAGYLPEGTIRVMLLIGLAAGLITILVNRRI